MRVRRPGDHLAPAARPYQPADGCTPLFDGFSLDNWRMSIIRNQPGRDDPGHFLVVDGTLEAVTGTDIGSVVVHDRCRPISSCGSIGCAGEDYDNSGVFIRFPNPETKAYNNNAFVAVDFRFEVQIDEFGTPDGQDIHKTGAIYRADGRRDGETFALKPPRPIGQWNQYEIVKGQNYQVFLNGDRVCVFDNPYPGRCLPSTAAEPTYIGLQTHTGRVAFRNIRYMALGGRCFSTPRAVFGFDRSGGVRSARSPPLVAPRIFRPSPATGSRARTVPPARPAAG